MSFLFISVLLVVSLIAIWFILHNKKGPDLPPGPWNLPILGSLLWLDLQEPCRSLTEFSKKYGPIFSLQFGKVYTVVVCDAKMLKKIFIKNESTGKAPLYVLDTVFKDNGIVFTEGNKWKESRKFIINYFHSIGATKLSPNKKFLQEKTMKCVDDFIQYVKNQGDRVVLNTSELFNHDVASASTSLYFGKFWQRDDELWKNMLYKILDSLKFIDSSGPLNFFPFLRFLPQYRRKLNVIFDMYSTLYAFYYDAIKKTKGNVQRKQSIVGAFFNSKISTMKMEDERLCSLLAELFSATIATTTNTLLWITLYLAKYKQVQTKLRQELFDVLQGNAPTIDDLAKLPFMQATMAEVARIRTVVPLGMSHSALEDIQVEEFRIPKGAMIMPFLWGIHMDPKVWKEPEKFRPERFLDHNGCFYKPESFIPFQTGQRTCVGEEIARATIFLFISAVLLNFEINNSPECEVDLDGVFGIALSPKPQNLVFTNI